MWKEAESTSAHPQEVEVSKYGGAGVYKPSGEPGWEQNPLEVPLQEHCTPSPAKKQLSAEAKPWPCSNPTTTQSPAARLACGQSWLSSACHMGAI